MPAVLPALVCLAYYGVIVLYAGVTANFAWIWLFFAAVLLGTKAPVVGKPAAVLLAAGLAVLILLLVPVFRGMFLKPVPGLAYVVVEGAQVKGTVPSRSLLKRLERAYAYAQENPDTILILSGGKGSGEDISEAECMERWLLAKGLPSERLIQENASTSTEENLLFSNMLTGCAEQPTGLITNDFHVGRSLILAKRLGYREVYGIPAKSDPVLQIHFTVREAFALLREFAAHGV